ncbi:leucine-rich repeat-containing protein 4C-like [Chrysoperla carnea]|uniref:leucine-rich repeat-containing protein 4C-like n=1 Tax=Chrysoperla carnea TaxID=189513 RepID=UPI001D075F5D|nr:leucine-rich repeat-containing protein 4C-like [Chrysoperla carnea]
MIKLQKTYLYIAVFTVILQIAQSAEAKCNLSGTKLLCTDVNNDELIENIKKYQPTYLVCDECTISKLNLQKLDVGIRKKLEIIEIIELLNILDFDLDTFSGVENLKSLRFKNATLQAIPPELFKPLSKLDEVIFSNCDVRTRVTHCFQHTPQLRKFTLKNALIYSIQAQWFEDIPNLVELDFSGNRLKNIDKDSFKKLLKLEKIILNKNDLKVLPTELFDNQSELKYLDVSHNPINQIDLKHIIDTNKKLDVLLIHDLPCQTFESKAEALQNDLQFVTECAQEGKDGPYKYKTSCVDLRSYDKRTPNEKLTIFQTSEHVCSDENFNGLPCVSNDRAKDLFKPRPKET